MGDEKVLRIEFKGDDSGDATPHDSQDRGQDSGVNEAHRRAQEFDDRQEQERDRQAREDAREHQAASKSFEDDLANRIKEGDDEPLPTEDSLPHQQPTYGIPVEAEVVDERPYFSQSRELALYDELTDRAGALHQEHTEFGDGPTATEGGGAGGGEPPITGGAAEGVEGAEAAAGGTVETAGGTLAAVGGVLAEIAGPVGIVVGGLTAMGVAVLEVTDKLVELYDSGLAQFEHLNGLIAANRAEQNVELIQQRIETANEIAPTTTSVIQEETEWKKAITKLEGHATVIIGTFLRPLLHLGTRILEGLDKALVWLHLIDPPKENKTDFQKEAEDFLSNLHTGQGLHHFGPKDHHTKPTRSTRNKPRNKNQPPRP